MCPRSIFIIMTEVGTYVTDFAVATTGQLRASNEG